MFLPPAISHRRPRGLSDNIYVDSSKLQQRAMRESPFFMIENRREYLQGPYKDVASDMNDMYVDYCHDKKCVVWARISKDTKTIQMTIPQHYKTEYKDRIQTMAERLVKYTHMLMVYMGMNPHEYTLMKKDGWEVTAAIKRFHHIKKIC